MQATARNGDRYLVECPNCYRGVGVGSLDGFTLAGSPGTRALWAEVERLRAEAAELRLDLAAEQGRQEGAPSAGWGYNGTAWLKHGGPLGSINVGRTPTGAYWSPDTFVIGTAPNMRAAMRAADEAEAQAVAKEPTP